MGGCLDTKSQNSNTGTGKYTQREVPAREGDGEMVVRYSRVRKGEIGSWERDGGGARRDREGGGERAGTRRSETGSL